VEIENSKNGRFKDQQLEMRKVAGVWWAYSCGIDIRV